MLIIRMEHLLYPLSQGPVLVELTVTGSFFSLLYAILLAVGPPDPAILLRCWISLLSGAIGSRKVG